MVESPGAKRARPPSDTTYLYLVRHGATAANEQLPYILQGDAIDIPLSPTGERQAAAVARFFRDFPIDRVYCSHLQRACQTAAAISAPHNLQTEIVEGLAECNVGCWEGLDWDTIRTRYPRECHLFHDNPAENPYMGGESYTDVLRRTQPVLQTLLEKHRGQSIVVVSHSVVIRAYTSALLGVPLRSAKALRQQNGCVNFITDSSAGTILFTFNSIFHLDQLPLST